MRRIRKYVHHWIDDRHGQAKARFFFRRRGFKQVSLPGLPGSPEFERAYAAAMAGGPLPSSIGSKRIRAGSIDALCIAYFNSSGFLALSESTKATYRGILEAFTLDHGAKPVALLTRKHLEAMLASKTRTPAAANHWLRLIKMLMRFAVREGMRSDDPARDIDYIKRKSSGFHTWSEDEIAQFEVHHLVSSRPRLALALLLYTAQRRSDVIKMGRQHVRNGIAQVRQQKTGTMLAIPVHPALQAVLDATPSEHLTFLVTEYGKPFTAAGFGNWFRDRCDEGGVAEALCRPRPAQGRLPAAR